VEKSMSKKIIFKKKLKKEILTTLEYLKTSMDAFYKFILACIGLDYPYYPITLNNPYLITPNSNLLKK
jgi:hypothetical protein